MADHFPYVRAGFEHEVAAIHAYGTLAARTIEQMGAVAVATTRAYADILAQTEAVSTAASWNDTEQKRAFGLWVDAQAATQKPLLAYLRRTLDRLWLVMAGADLDGVAPTGVPILDEKAVAASEAWLRRQNLATINEPARIGAGVPERLRRLGLGMPRPLRRGKR